ncbi:hypothetical protein ATCC27039_00580 [Actinomyces naeslundii]|nr:hypothetical protein ATCC27039_00580 [Actinomyces naeslundii]
MTGGDVSATGGDLAVPLIAARSRVVPPGDRLRPAGPGLAVQGEDRGAHSSAVTVAAMSAMVWVRAGTRTWADGGVRVSCAFAPWWGRPAGGPQDDGTCSDLSGFLRRRSKWVSAK